MKLATLKDRTRDGMLVVVSRDLTRCVSARPFAPTLQAALDDWEHVAPRLADLAHDLELGAVPSERFHEHQALSPLPRAYQLAVAVQTVNQTSSDGHAAGRDTGDGPRLHQIASDGLLAPRGPIAVTGDTTAVVAGAGVAAVVGDVGRGSSREAAAEAIRLVVLFSSVSLSDPDGEPRAGSLSGGARLATTLSPVAVTPDELGHAFDGGRVAAHLLTTVNGKPLPGSTGASGGDVDLAALTAAAAPLRALTAGSIIGSGPVATATLQPGDTVRIEMKDRGGHSIFGAIEQTVERDAG